MANRRNEYVKRRWCELIHEYGGACQRCGKQYDLEFAHLQPTGLHGAGRGKARRLADILANRILYSLLCMECHDIQDGRNRRRQQDYIKGCKGEA